MTSGVVVVTPKKAPPEPQSFIRAFGSTISANNAKMASTKNDFLLAQVPKRAMELKYERELNAMNQKRTEELSQANTMLVQEIQRRDDEIKELR